MQTKLDRGALIALVSATLAAPVHAQPVPDDAAVQLLQRVNELEQELRTLRGENETLQNEVESLRQNQKDGFLQVDERIGRLRQPDTDADTTPPAENTPLAPVNVSTPTPSTDSNGTIIIPPITDTPSTEPAPETDATTADVTPSPPVATPNKPANPNKLDKNDPRGFYSYGNGQTDDKNILNKPAETQDTTTGDAAEKPDKEISEANEERRAYDHAFQTLLQDPKESIPEFRAFLKDYPDSSLAPSAQYWVGEALYAERDFESAVKEFLVVLKDHKESNKAPDAALKLGYSFYELQDWEKARKTLEDVISFFPDNAETSRLAKERLDKMTTEGH